MRYRDGVVDVLADTPLLTVFVTIALGTAVGAIPFGPIRFGPAGALFVGLALGAWDARLGEGLDFVQTLGLALFVYTVGLAAGNTFFRDLKRQLPLMGLGIAATAIAAVLVVVLGTVFGINAKLQGGMFAGSLTSTPTLAAASDATNSTEPAVGYSLGYPAGVLFSIILVALIINKKWTAKRDPDSAAAAGLEAATAEVTKHTALHDVPGFAAQDIRMSYLLRDKNMRVIGMNEQLQPGDQVVVVGSKPAVDSAIDHLGLRLDEHLADDRTAVDYRRFVVSNPQVAGRSVAELDIPERFSGVMTRVRRGDLDLLARDDLTLELGDRVLTVVPRERLRDISTFLGDSERRVSEVDAFTLGLGMALGLVLGLVSIPLGGAVAFTIGAAAGPLIMGMILGRVERTGPLIWGLPHAANLTIRQMGLVLFLAAVGLSSGSAFAQQAFTLLGLKIVLSSAVVVLLSGFIILRGARLLGLSAPRAAGALAGFVGQPAVLAYGTSRISDERVEAGYSALFALCILVKIIAVSIIVVL